MANPIWALDPLLGCQSKFRILLLNYEYTSFFSDNFLLKTCELSITPLISKFRGSSVPGWSKGCLVHWVRSHVHSPKSAGLSLSKCWIVYNSILVIRIQVLETTLPNGSSLLRVTSFSMPPGPQHTHTHTSCCCLCVFVDRNLLSVGLLDVFLSSAPSGLNRRHYGLRGHDLSLVKAWPFAWQWYLGGGEAASSSLWGKGLWGRVIRRGHSGEIKGLVTEWQGGLILLKVQVDFLPTSVWIRLHYYPSSGLMGNSVRRWFVCVVYYVWFSNYVR